MDTMEENEHTLRAISSMKSKPFTTKLEIEGKLLKIEIDTGASLVSEQTLQSQLARSMIVKAMSHTDTITPPISQHPSAVVFS